MPDLPRFTGRDGAAEAHARGLETIAGWRRRGRQVRPGARPRGLYEPASHDDRRYALYALEDTELPRQLERTS